MYKRHGVCVLSTVCVLAALDMRQLLVGLENAVTVRGVSFNSKILSVRTLHPPTNTHAAFATYRPVSNVSSTTVLPRDHKTRPISGVGRQSPHHLWIPLTVRLTCCDVGCAALIMGRVGVNGIPGKHAPVSCSPFVGCIRPSRHIEYSTYVGSELSLSLVQYSTTRDT